MHNSNKYSKTSMWQLCHCVLWIFLSRSKYSGESVIRWVGFFFFGVQLFHQLLLQSCDTGHPVCADHLLHFLPALHHPGVSGGAHDTLAEITGCEYLFFSCLLFALCCLFWRKLAFSRQELASSTSRPFFFVFFLFFVVFFPPTSLLIVSE